VAGAAGLVLVAGAAGWFISTREPPVDPKVAAVQDGLAAAQKALDAGNLVAPPDQSAVFHFNAVLEADPQNAAAEKGLDDIAERFIGQAETMIVEGRLEEAQNALAAVRLASPQHRRLRFLDTQLRKEQQDRLVLRARESATAGDLRRAQQLLEEAAKVSPGTPGDSAEVNAARQTLAERERSQGVARSLETARQRIAQNRLVQPENDSAEFHLRAAQRLEPGNIAVQQALRDLGTRTLAEARQAVERNQFEAARNWIEQATQLGVPAAEINPVRQSLESAVRDRPKNELLQLVLRRIDENRLVEPAEDSASHHLARLRQLDPQFAGLPRAVETLGTRLVANAQVAISQRQFDSAARLLGAARDIGFSGGELAAAETALSSARTPATSAPRVPQEVPPRRVKYVAPAYPRQALESGAEGWVDVSFEVTTTGDVTDAVVVATSRRGLFERSALVAVRQWKFEARPQLDPAFTQRVRMRVEFQLQD
jgi:periplasmic protein TonB